MSFYSELATDADALLTEFGQSVTVRRQSAGAYNPDTGASSITTTDVIGHGAVFDRNAKDIDGAMIQHGDKQLLLSASGMAKPSTADTVIIGGESWRVIDPQEISPAGIPVLYDINIRK